MQIVEHKYRPENWDKLIEEYDTKTLFHETCWHDHIASIHKRSEMKYFSIEKRGKVIGYFCSLFLKKIIFKIAGSPLTGTGTNYMGPIVNKDIDQEELINAIDSMIKRLGIHYLETSNDIYQSSVMEKYGFQMSNRRTHKIALPSTPEEALSNFKSTGRNRLKKGLKNNLLVEITNDPEIVNVYFEQLKEVYGKVWMSVPYSVERVKSLYDSLLKKDKLAPIWVKNGDEVIAAGLFPHDRNAIYFWGATSWLKDQHLCPNEVLHWELFRYAIKKGIRVQYVWR